MRTDADGKKVDLSGFHMVLIYPGVLPKVSLDNTLVFSSAVSSFCQPSCRDKPVDLQVRNVERCQSVGRLVGLVLQEP